MPMVVNPAFSAMRAESMSVSSPPIPGPVPNRISRFAFPSTRESLPFRTKRRQYNLCASTQGPRHAQPSLDVAANHDHIGLIALA